MGCRRPPAPTTDQPLPPPSDWALGAKQLQRHMPLVSVLRTPYAPVAAVLLRQDRPFAGSAKPGACSRRQQQTLYAITLSALSRTLFFAASLFSTTAAIHNSAGAPVQRPCYARRVRQLSHMLWCHSSTAGSTAITNNCKPTQTRRPAVPAVVTRGATGGAACGARPRV
jgi:hypothetical protein